MVELDEPTRPAPLEDSEEEFVSENGCDPSGAEAEPIEERGEASANMAANTVPPHISLTPPDDCIPVTKDGGVLKKVLEAGYGDEKPSLHARCLLHYVGYLASSGELFMDTRQDRETEEPVVVVAGRTAAALETGLCLAAATMCRGERALVYIQDPVYGYGALGSFSFPCVPPNSQLVYEVHMINWEGVEETDNDRDRGSLLFEERLERAERRMDAGNQLYREENFKGALAKYALALSYMDEDFMYQLEGHYLDKAEAVKLRIHLNMAAAQLKTGDFNTAIYNCGQVLNIDPQNVKALFRRGKAKHALGRTEEAKEDLQAAIKISPTDKDILRELRDLKATQKEELLAQKALFQDRFKGAGITTTTTTTAEATATTAATGSGQQPLAASGGNKSDGLTKRTSRAVLGKTGHGDTPGGGGGKLSVNRGEKGVFGAFLVALASLWYFIAASASALSRALLTRVPVQRKSRSG